MHHACNHRSATGMWYDPCYVSRASIFVFCCFLNYRNFQRLLLLAVLLLNASGASPTATVIYR